MVYKLLAVNVDGTLLQSNGRLNKVTKEAIQYVHEKGVHVALVTSRNYLSTKKVAKALKINPMMVAMQGAFVGTTIQKPLFFASFQEALTLELVTLLEKMNCHIRLIHEDYLLGNRVNLPENLISKSVMYENEQNIYTHKFVDSLCEYIEENPSTPSKIDLIFQSEKEKNDALTVLQNMFPEVRITELNEYKLTIVPNGVSKWRGVLYLADHYNVKKSEIVSIGDGLDDLEMIAGSGLGVAMGNAAPEVKNTADWITRCNNDNGVAYMLKEFFRKQQPIEFLIKMNVLKD
jgi:Cof subfamily protein (haloacid dehalogenase superfamily)